VVVLATIGAVAPDQTEKDRVVSPTPTSAHDSGYHNTTVRGGHDRRDDAAHIATFHVTCNDRATALHDNANYRGADHSGAVHGGPDDRAWVRGGTRRSVADSGDERTPAGLHP
jgi:hypothetical protein